MNSCPPLICCRSAPNPRRSPYPHPPLVAPITRSFHFTHFAMLPPAHSSCHSLAFLIHNVRIVCAVALQVFLSSFIFCNISVCSLSLRASRECQNKERLLEQRFRAALRDFQQWLVNAKISTAKCFDVPQNVAEASNALQRIQVRVVFFSLFVMGIWECTFLITCANSSLKLWVLLSCLWYCLAAPAHQTLIPGQKDRKEPKKLFWFNHIFWISMPHTEVLFDLHRILLSV